MSYTYFLISIKDGQKLKIQVKFHHLVNHSVWLGFLMEFIFLEDFQILKAEMNYFIMILNSIDGLIWLLKKECLLLDKVIKWLLKVIIYTLWEVVQLIINYIYKIVIMMFLSMILKREICLNSHRLNKLEKDFQWQVLENNCLFLEDKTELIILMIFNLHI